MQFIWLRVSYHTISIDFCKINSDETQQTLHILNSNLILFATNLNVISMFVQHSKCKDVLIMQNS